MRGQPRFPLRSLPTVVIASVVAVLAGVALLARIPWLAAWLVCEGVMLWRILPGYATTSPGGRIWVLLFVAVYLGLGLQGLVALWNRW